jgi:hypothetical protein
MQLKFKKITSWSNFEIIGKDKGLYWLSFGGKSGYIGIVFGGDRKTTIYNRWKNDHDRSGDKWVRHSVEKKYPGWSLKIDKKDQNASIHIWTYKTPRKRGRPSISKTTLSRKKILEAVESIVIFYVAKSRWNKSTSIDSYKKKKAVSSSNMLLNDQKLEGVKKAKRGNKKKPQEKFLNYLEKHLGNRKLIITGGPKDTTKIPDEKISYLVKEVFYSKSKLSTERIAATKQSSMIKRPDRSTASASSGKSTTRNSQRKRTCKHFGCNTCPRGRNQYCSVHKKAKTKKKPCRKRGCSVVPKGRLLYCSKHRP